MFTFSNEHYDYLKKIKKEKQIIFFFRILIVILFMFVWEVLALYYGRMNDFLKL